MATRQATTPAAAQSLSMAMTIRTILAATALFAASCASFDSRFVIEVSPQLPLTSQTVSVLGALKDGRLDADYWRSVQPELGKTLGAGGCALLFDEALLARDEPLYNRIDQQSREDGVGDELLRSVEPHAQGQLVMVAYAAGKLPDPHAKRPSSQKQQRYSSLAGRHSGRGWHPLEANKRNAAAEDDGLDLSLYFYSVAAHASVAQISLHYTGQSVDEATRLLGDKLRATFPDFHCVGWR
jgi:hypothetical protein